MPERLTSARSAGVSRSALLGLIRATLRRNAKNTALFGLIVAR